MKKHESKKNAKSLPPGLVAYKGTPKEMAKLKKWLKDEPDSLAFAGPNVRFRQKSAHK